jgi:LuxR family maltose regulon positive regulatory protein
MEQATKQLTERELEILSQLADGKINKEIANKLNISVGTVKQHLFHIYTKIEVNNRVEAANAYRDLISTKLNENLIE